MIRLGKIFLYLSYDEAAELVSKGWSLAAISAYDRYCVNKAMKKRMYETAAKTTKRDSMVQKVYFAEDMFRSIVGVGESYKSLHEIQVFIKKVITSTTWKSISRGTLVKKVHTKMKDSHKNKGYWALAEGNCITFTEKAMNQIFVLHELAHVAGYWNHDVGWRNAYIKLVSRFMSKESGTTLKNIFKHNGIKLKVNTDIKTPEQWYKGYTKMIAARSTKKRTKVFNLEKVILPEE